MRTATTFFNTKKSTRITNNFFLKTSLRLLRVKFGLFTVVLNLLLMLAVQSKATAQKNIPTSKSTDVIALQSQQLSQKHLLAESIKPTVVRIVNGLCR
jgi:hypothetical protein